MEKELQSLRHALVQALHGLKNSSWHRVNLTIDFPPFINKGYKGAQFFWDANGNLVDLFLPSDQEFQNRIYNFIYEVNQQGNYNQVVFSAEKDKLNEAEISVIFNQAVEENFQNNLPKSKRGKTVPWWKQELSSS
jgi:hypothetical protein